MIKEKIKNSEQESENSKKENSKTEPPVNNAHRKYRLPAEKRHRSQSTDSLTFLRHSKRKVKSFSSNRLTVFNPNDDTKPVGAEYPKVSGKGS